MASQGRWTRLPDGTSLWSLSIVSKGATSHIIVFRCKLYSSAWAQWAADCQDEALLE